MVVKGSELFDDVRLTNSDELPFVASCNLFVALVIAFAIEDSGYTRIQEIEVSATRAGNS